MSVDDNNRYGGMSLAELFRSEAEGQVQALTGGLLALERNAQDIAVITPLMRAAHSLKGAARIVGLEDVERLSHAMEDCFIAAQKGRLRLTRPRIDRLLAAVDLISRISALSEAEAPAWLEANRLVIGDVLLGVYDAADADKLNDGGEPVPVLAGEAPPLPLPVPPEPPEPASLREDQVLKVSARSFDRLLGLAGEARVTAHGLQPLLQAMLQLKKRHLETFPVLDQLLQDMDSEAAGDRLKDRARLLRQRSEPLRQALADRLADIEAFERRLLGITQGILDEVLALRMRPFRDGVQAFPRMVRDLARSLGKSVSLEIAGEDTLVDRDVLARMESPLNHMLLNAVDHGIESSEARVAAGKRPEGLIRLEARHSGGMLLIEISDDGRGVDPELIRKTVVARRMATAQMAADMSNEELLDFLFLPSFSLKETASEVSGRGVGLDVVHAAVRELFGSIRLESVPGQGFRTTIVVPLSQSVARAVVVDIAGDPYAIPIARIDRILKLAPEDLHMLEGRLFFTLDGTHVGVVSAAQILELGPDLRPASELPVVVVGSGQRRYALAVDRILGEQNLAVQPIDTTFGKLRDISAAAVLLDGSPVLILDMEDLLVSIDKLLSEGALQRLPAPLQHAGAKAKRILVVDDSLTVREMERKLLASHGFSVDVAVDGMDGWNAVRSAEYDLVITDVDMPRMDGIELVTLIKKDNRLHNLPVMIVSYKDRPEDRARGVTAGADYYLTKGSFHDETLLEAVFDLIGESRA